MTTARSILLTVLLTVFMALAVMPASAADTIYISTGQCIHVGGQQVCAIDPGMRPAGTPAPPPEHLHVCRYDKHAGSEFTDLKTWALIRITIQPGGAKTELIVRNFGITDADKKNCEAEAERLRSSPPG